MRSRLAEGGALAMRLSLVFEATRSRRSVLLLLQYQGCITTAEKQCRPTARAFAVLVIPRFMAGGLLLHLQPERDHLPVGAGHGAVVAVGQWSAGRAFGARYRQGGTQLRRGGDLQAKFAFLFLRAVLCAQ